MDDRHFSCITKLPKRNPEVPPTWRVKYKIPRQSGKWCQATWTWERKWGVPNMLQDESKQLVLSRKVPKGLWVLSRVIFFCGKDPIQRHWCTSYDICNTERTVNSHSCCCLSQYISRLPIKIFINERFVSIFFLNSLQVFKGMAFALKYLVNLVVAGK